MKKVLKWIGIGFAVFVAVIAVVAFLGKEQTLNLQIGPVNMADIPDGEYTGKYDCYRWSNEVIVTVRDHQITAIESVKGQDGRESIRQEMTEQVIQAQDTAIDAVSGATADKKAFLKAVENALRGTPVNS